MDPSLKMNEKNVQQNMSAETNYKAQNQENVEEMDVVIVENGSPTYLPIKRESSPDYLPKFNKKFKSDLSNGLDYEPICLDITASKSDFQNEYTKICKYANIKDFFGECYFFCGSDSNRLDLGDSNYLDKLLSAIKNELDVDINEYRMLIEASLKDDLENLPWTKEPTISNEPDTTTKIDENKLLDETVLNTELPNKDNEENNLNNTEVNDKPNDFVLTPEEQTQLVVWAKQEAEVMKKVNELRKKGLWSLKRLPKVKEPERTKTHWDYLLEEMQWLAVDFSAERKWKVTSARRCAKAGQKFHLLKVSEKDKKAKEDFVKIKKRANALAKLSKTFWSDMGKIFDKKQELLLEEKRKKIQNIQLKYIVDKADHLTERLAQELVIPQHKNLIESSNCSDKDSSICPGDEDFEQGSMCSDDDEETLDIEEKQCQQGNSKDEINELLKDSEIPIEQLLKEYKIDLDVSESMETDENASGYNDEMDDDADDDEDTDVEADDEEEEEETDDEMSSNDEDNFDSLINDSKVNLVFCYYFIYKNIFNLFRMTAMSVWIRQKMN